MTKSHIQIQMNQLKNHTKVSTQKLSKENDSPDASESTSTSGSSSSASNSSLFSSYQRWSSSLDDLINDELGRKLFTEYLKDTHNSDNILQFYTLLKCRHSCQSDDDIKSLVNLTYTNFFIKNPVKCLTDGLRDKLSIALEQHRYDDGLFDKAYKELNDCLIGHYYPKFLQSKIYLNSLKILENQSCMQNLLELSETNEQYKLLLKYINSSFESSQAKTTSKRSNSTSKVSQTLNKFSIPSIPVQTQTNGKLINTPSALKSLKTKLNESTLSSKSYKDKKSHAHLNHIPNPYTIIGKVIPVSAQDSEIQSQLSTDDDKSRTRHNHALKSRSYIHQSVQLNKHVVDSNMPLIQIPRTMQEPLSHNSTLSQTNPHEFAKLLIGKLEEAIEYSQRKYKSTSSFSTTNQKVSQNDHNDETIVNGDSDMDADRMIDAHVNRVFKSTHDLSQQPQAPLNNTHNQSCLNKSGTLTSHNYHHHHHHQSVITQKEVDIDDRKEEYAKRKSHVRLMKQSEDISYDSGVSTRSVASIERVNDWLSSSKPQNTTSNISTQHPPPPIPIVPSVPTKVTPQSNTNTKTTVAYYLPGEEVAYITTFNSSDDISLAQFKSLITKKGHFRYFFKTKSDLLDEECIVYQEITDDSSLIPKFNGKVICKIEKHNEK